MIGYIYVCLHIYSYISRLPPCVVVLAPVVALSYGFVGCVCLVVCSEVYERHKQDDPCTSTRVHTPSVIFVQLAERFFSQKTSTAVLGQELQYTPPQAHTWSKQVLSLPSHHRPPPLPSFFPIDPQLAGEKATARAPPGLCLAKCQRADCINTEVPTGPAFCCCSKCGAKYCARDCQVRVVVPVCGAWVLCGFCGAPVVFFFRPLFSAVRIAAQTESPSRALVDASAEEGGGC